MRSFLLSLCTIFLILAAVQGAVFRGAGPCPDGIQSGGEWYPEGQCMKCVCSSWGYTCYSCGSVLAGPGCSIVDGPAEANYPDCCPDIVCE